MYFFNFIGFPGIETVAFLISCTFPTIFGISEFIMTLLHCRLEPLTGPGQVASDWGQLEEQLRDGQRNFRLTAEG